MLLSDLLRPEDVIERLRVVGKRRALQKLAQRAASATGYPEAAIASVLRARERLGSTGIGRGVAVPHARLADLDHPFGLFARLDQPIDFAAVDDQPVDLIFLILAPTASASEQLSAMSLAIRLFRDDDLCKRLRQADDAPALFALLADAAAIKADALRLTERSLQTRPAPRFVRPARPLERPRP